jgi:hypothetical protein
MLRTTLLLLFSLLTSSSNAQVSRRDSVKFVKLSFAVKDQVASIEINPAYKAYKSKASFPLSLFISVNTLYHDKNGFPTPVETKAFKQLETGLLNSLRPFRYCYIGKTMINGSRDIILYIRRQDQPRISNALAVLKRNNSRLTAYTFEVDPKWEAVEEFYGGLE